MRDPAERLRDILEAIAAIERRMPPTKAELEQDELLQVWCLRFLQLIGEAARTLPATVRDRAPDVPWPQIIGMRNVLVHTYFAIDIDAVWNAVARDVPGLKPSIERLLAELGPDI